MTATHTGKVEDAPQYDEPDFMWARVTLPDMLTALEAMALLHGRPPRSHMRLGSKYRSPFKPADPTKKAARKRQKKARAITRRAS